MYSYDDRVVVFRSPRSLVLRRATAATRELIGALSAGVPAGELGADRLGTVHQGLVKRLGPNLVHRFSCGGRELMRVEPAGRTGIDVSPRPLSGGDLRLSRFALMRAVDSGLLVESPRSGARVIVTDADVWSLLFALDRTQGADGGVPQCRGLDPEVVAGLLGVLLRLDLLDEQRPTAASEPRFTEDDDASLRQWQFHDLLFHVHGRTSSPQELRFLDELPPQPAIKPETAGAVVELHRPRRADIHALDPRITSVIESRRSVTSYGAEPLTAGQLGEFLYRTARVKSRYGAREGLYYDWDSRPPYERTRRPYPSAGASYELELYVTVLRCAGIAPGSYHYDPLRHCLRLVNDSEQDNARLLASVSLPGTPDVVLTITSRIHRLTWNYASSAVTLTFQHVGALHQTMYLVATAMRLAPCALKGTEDPGAVTEALALPALEEVVVGAFALGSPPDDPRPAATTSSRWQPVNDADW
ncbi:SagB family peptide dehydrogenase [Streptomyces sp. NBC_01136]|uniref:SagB family peptide dehydrogenase n=1 Tax=unclassified Streptomyces TaxID=2593676 RepID=UPI00324C5D9A|nr:SagB family peptide dehydrogenase [Streptomyces sp. NBC_01136]